MIAPNLPRFDLLGPISRGVTLLEASAGTGKTWSITGLVLRLVVDYHVDISQIAVVTFTKAATAELKERIRLRLEVAERVLLQGESTEDPLLLQWLERLDDEGRGRVARARGAWDQVHVSTMHGFAQAVLHQHAFECGLEPGLELVVDTEPWRDALVEDWLVRQVNALREDERARWFEMFGVNPAPWRELCRLALAEPDAPVVPPPEDVWEVVVERLRQHWHEGDALRALTAAKLEGYFAPRQRSFGVPSTVEKARAVTEWLRTGAPWSRWEQALLALGRDAIRAKLAPGVLLEAIERSPGLVALDEVIAEAQLLPARHKSAFVHWIREAYREKKERQGALDYGDLLRELARRLDRRASPDVRELLISALRSRFRAVMIDEFQDTDALQWTVFREAFAHANGWLFLIGDPKQAIYAFRGADIRVYLHARGAAGGSAWTMGRNHRSDRRFIEASHQLMDQPGFFGDVGFEYVAVDTPEREPMDRLVRASACGPLTLMLWDRRLISADGDSGPVNSLAGADGPLAARVTEDVVQLLSAGHHVLERGGQRPLGPEDVAVLVRTNRQALLMHRALSGVGVPARVTAEQRVWEAEVVEPLEDWLWGLSDLSNSRALRRTATCSFFGWTAQALDALDAGDEAALARWSMWLRQMQEWRDIWDNSGPLAALRAMMADADLERRWGGSARAARWLADLAHLGEQMQGAAHEIGRAPGEFARWLQRRRASGGDEDARIRLEHEEPAVTILTVHKSKGLEFGVVFVPWMSGQAEISVKSSGEPRRAQGVLLPQGGGGLSQTLWLQLGQEEVAVARRFSREEGMRLLYVALTRAKYRTVLYVGDSPEFPHSPVGAALGGEDARRLTQEGIRFDASIRRWFDKELVEVRWATPAVGLRWSHPLRAPVSRPSMPDGVGAHRRGDGLWSYTAIARGARVPEPTSEPAEPPATGDGIALPFEGLPSDDRVGSWLHAALEHVPFQVSAADVERELRDRAVGFGVDPRWVPDAAAGLTSVLLTPLGGPLGERTLSSLVTSPMARELRFDLPLEVVDLERLRATVWPVEAQRPALSPRLGETLRGMLTGTLDLVFSVKVEGHVCWFVADYKSNRVSPPGETPSFAHYRGTALRREMRSHLYDLQALLYGVALHRLLRWRLADYTPERDLGGSYYLFLRGMAGPLTPLLNGTRAGVFYEPPRVDQIVALDHLFGAKP